MAHKFLAILSASILLLMPPARGGAISYLGDVAHTQQNVVRSFDGTVSHYAKSLATPYAHVHKQDTRITNNVYQPANLAKSVAYAAPEPVHHHQPALFTQAAPVYHQVQPQAPLQHQFQYQPQPHPQQISSPSVAYAPHGHQPAVVHYSPAETVSHISFDGFGSHWGY